MMRFTVDETKHEFDEEKLTFGEGRALEKTTGYAFGEMSDHAEAGELTVIQAFIWVALKRTEPTLKFSDLDDRYIADFEFEPEPEDEDENNAGEGAEGGAPTPTDGVTGSTSDASATSETSPVS